MPLSCRLEPEPAAAFRIAAGIGTEVFCLDFENVRVFQHMVGQFFQEFLDVSGGFQCVHAGPVRAGENARPEKFLVFQSLWMPNIFTKTMKELMCPRIYILESIMKTCFL